MRTKVTVVVMVGRGDFSDHEDQYELLRRRLRRYIVVVLILLKWDRPK